MYNKCRITKRRDKYTVVDLLGYRTLELSLNNQSAERGSLELKHTFSYNVSYNEGQKKGLGFLNFVMKNEKTEGGLCIKVSLVADFVYSEGDDRKYIHKESFRQVFPYLRMTVTNLCSCAGIGGIIIPNLTINDDQIKNI